MRFKEKNKRDGEDNGQGVCNMMMKGSRCQNPFPLSFSLFISFSLAVSLFLSLVHSLFHSLSIYLSFSLSIDSNFLSISSKTYSFPSLPPSHFCKTYLDTRSLHHIPPLSPSISLSLSLSLFLPLSRLPPRRRRK